MSKGLSPFILALGLAAAVSVPAPAEAHHSFAMYDRCTMETLTGKLTRFNTGADHAQLNFEIVGPDAGRHATR